MTSVPTPSPNPTPGSDSPALRQHRNRLAGLWAAELLGLLGQAARDYAHDLARAHAADGDNDDAVFHRLSADLAGRVQPHEIRQKLSHLVAEARRQLTRH